MLNARFAEIARQPDAPFLRAASDDETFGLTVEAASVSARVNDGAVEKGLRALGEEIARVRQHGFGEAELDRAKRSALASYERAFNERSYDRERWIRVRVAAQLPERRGGPGHRNRAQSRASVPPDHHRAGDRRPRRATSSPTGIASSLRHHPQKAGLVAVTEPVLREALAAGTSATVTAWRDEMGGRELIAKKPEPGKVTSRREIPEIGVTVLTLSNGVEVWLKPTDFRNDQVVFSSYARGGLSLVGARRLPQRVAGHLARGHRRRRRLHPDRSRQAAGRPDWRSVRVCLQLLAGGQRIEHTEGPRDRAAAGVSAFHRAQRESRSVRADEAAPRGVARQPGAESGSGLRRARSPHQHVSITTAPVRCGSRIVPRLDPGKMLSFYKQVFANAANFTFFFVGTFTVDGVTPLIEQYLGSLAVAGVAGLAQRRHAPRVSDVRRS